IFSLPNGLQGYMLVDAKGKRIDKGPTSIVSDPKRPDRAVENGLSCMSCHARGIIPKADQVRAHALKNARSFAAAELDAVKDLYPLGVEGGTVQRQVFVVFFPELIEALKVDDFLAPRDAAYARLIRQGEKRFFEGDAAGAVAALGEAIALDPGQALAHACRA